MGENLNEWQTSSREAMKQYATHILGLKDGCRGFNDKFSGENDSRSCIDHLVILSSLPVTSCVCEALDEAIVKKKKKVPHT